VREKEVVAGQAYALVLCFGMVLDVAITPEMWSLRRCGSLMQGDLAASFARGRGVEVTTGVAFYTYAPDVDGAWITLSALWTRLRTCIHWVKNDPASRGTDSALSSKAVRIE
jgi:hypothetical protein